MILTAEQVRTIRKTHVAFDGCCNKCGPCLIDNDVPCEGFPCPTLAQMEAEVEALHPGSCLDCGHTSDCALHSEPAYRAEPCDCSGKNKK